jgi:excisionase family DNA binding protein
MPAEHLGTSLRFVRRLVFERRIPFVKVGRHVRIAASDLDAFIAAGRIEAGENFLYQVQGRPRPECHPRNPGIASAHHHRERGE